MGVISDFRLRNLALFEPKDSSRHSHNRNTTSCLIFLVNVE